jgi:hypothetical protein
MLVRAGCLLHAAARQRPGRGRSGTLRRGQDLIAESGDGGVTGSRDTKSGEHRLAWLARIPLLFLALVSVGGPIAYYTWYVTAPRVTVTVTACKPSNSGNRSCHGTGTWTMPDGTTGSGAVEGTNIVDVGRSFPARATHSWALPGGPLSGPGGLAALFCAFDLMAATLLVVVMVLRRRIRRWGPPPPPLVPAPVPRRR